MAFQHKPGSGSLFKNDEKNDVNHADYTGSGVLLDGTEVWVNGWLKRPEGKKPFMSLSFKLKQQRVQAPASTPEPSFQGDDEIPFGF